MNAIRMLTTEHDEVKAMFKEFEGQSGKGAKAQQAKQELAAKVIEELKAHAQIEEQIFYPAVLEKAKGETHDLIIEGIEEHRVADFMMERLQQAGPGEEVFDARFKVLIESVKHHINEEERSLFPEARKLLENDLERLGEEMQKLHDQLEG